MAMVLWEVKDGLRPAEAGVMIRDFHGRREFLPVDRSMLSKEGNRYYLSVGLIHIFGYKIPQKEVCPVFPF
jgi:hypothetical protein